METDNNFNERLRRIRMIAGLTGKELASKAGIPYPTYMAYENRNRQPSAENLAKIAAALGVTSEYLLHDASLYDEKKRFLDARALAFIKKNPPSPNEIKTAFEENHASNKSPSNLRLNLNALETLRKVDYDITADIEQLRKKLLNNKATFGLKPIDAKTRKEFFMRFNQIVNDLLYQDYFSDDETADNAADENEHNAPPADIEENKAHKKSVD